MLVATAVVASETFFVVSFFGKSMCKSLLCRLHQLDTLHVLPLQSFEKLPGLKQLKHSRNFLTCSRRSITFIDLNLSHVQINCCPSSKGHSMFLGLLDSSAFETNVIVFGLSRLRNLFLSTDEFACANKFSWITALEASKSLKIIRLPLSSRRSWIHCTSCLCSPSTSYLVSNNWNTVETSWHALVVQLLYWFEFVTRPNKLLSIFKGTFNVLGFARFFSIWNKCNRLWFITASKSISVNRWVCLC